MSCLVLGPLKLSISNFRLFQIPNFRIIYILIKEKTSQTVMKKSKSNYRQRLNYDVAFECERGWRCQGWNGRAVTPPSTVTADGLTHTLFLTLWINQICSSDSTILWIPYV